MPVRLQLPFPTDREAPQATRCDDPKKCNSRQPSGLDLYWAKGPVSLRKCASKKRSLRTAFGFLFTPTARLPKRPAAMTRKSAAQDGLRLLANPFRKISPVARYDASKKYSSRRPLAFGRSPAKSPVSLRRYTPEKCLRQTAFGFWSILFEKSLQRPNAMARKSAAPDSFRLWIYTEQKVSPAFGDVPQPFVSGCRL